MHTSHIRHTHPANRAPLIVRLRDLAPHLSHASRARLALDRIIDHADALDQASDRAAAYAALGAIHAGQRIEEFAPTEVTERRLFLIRPLDRTGLASLVGAVTDPRN